jgi:hypothetical protein
VIVRATLMLALFCHPAFATPLRCPPLLPSAHEGFRQIGPVPTAHWQLHELRLFEVPINEEAKSALARLAPGETHSDPGGFTSSWRFARAEELMMVCDYNGAGTYYLARLPPAPRICVMERQDGLTRAWCE